MYKPGWTLTVATLVAVAALALAYGVGLGQAPTPAPAPAPTTEPAPVVEIAPAPPIDQKLADNWDNLLHFILLADVKPATDFAKAIIQASPNVKDLYYLSIRTPTSTATLARGRNIKELTQLIDQISKLIDDGAKAVRMDPTEIARWIEMLSGSPRQFISATDRLINSGEYAVPQLVNALADPKTSIMARERIISVLPRLGKDAVRPLSEALAVKDPAVKEILCRALGKIGYKHAAPYLKEVADTKDILARVREAALNALADCDPRGLKKPIAELCYDAATMYYHNKDSVRPDSRYQTANVWYWKEDLGLDYKVVPTPLFNDICAMRLAQAALRHDSGFYPAVNLWLAASLRKETTATASGLLDPTRAPDEPTADFYALAAGAKNLQAVLEIALKDGDTAVAVRAISALSRTAGAQNLVAAVEGGAQPLVAALTYPAREARYLAAEALAMANPQKPFPGSYLVVPVLVEALRQPGTPTAVLADPDQQHRNKVKDLLRAAGMDVADAGALGPALQTARSAGGVDLVVLASDITAPDIGKAVALLRGEPAISRVPVIVVARPAETTIARDVGKGDPLTVILPDEQTDAAGLASAVKDASAKAAGANPTTAPASGEAAAEWAIRAAKTLEMLAETRNPVYDLVEATKSLIAATRDKRDGVKVAAADALARYRDPFAQQAIAELAEDAAATEEVRLAAYAALSASIRQFGNELTEKQINAIIDSVSAKGALKIRDGAAGVLGALALPSEKIKDLILNAR